MISGPAIASDENLLNSLEQNAEVIRNVDNSEIDSIIRSHKVDLILLEILGSEGSGIELIKTLRRRFPHVAIVVIDGNGDQDKLVKAFNYGVKDAFRKPYKSDLIAERVNAILGCTSGG